MSRYYPWSVILEKPLFGESEWKARTKSHADKLAVDLQERGAVAIGIILN